MWELLKKWPNKRMTKDIFVDASGGDIAKSRPSFNNSARLLAHLFGKIDSFLLFCSLLQAQLEQNSKERINFAKQMCELSCWRTIAVSDMHVWDWQCNLLLLDDDFITIELLHNNLLLLCYEYGRDIHCHYK